ncbi:hypothetical protein [Rhodococcus sp. UNC363MFTsu5.1]|uniref:hypothetical protein n=1 Tax=Rhodococcus sp. UNC363MFTsu5.1 TaxID=1449069 RepID=UPI000B0FBA74|nr:hypothetical protein [Rhodococcus sp. UNC363MFTsu5.1]
MSNNMMRRGASILAAAAVVAGGLTVGAGTASAFCIQSGGLAQLKSISQPTCQNARNRYVEETVAGFRVGHDVPISAAPGDEVWFFIGINNSGDPARGVTKVVHHPPEGFVLKSVNSYTLRLIAAENRYETVPVALTSEVDPATGAVTLKAPPGQPLSVADRLYVDAKYQVEDFIVGASGVTFEATDLPETRDWVAKGWTAPQKLPGFGSSGS